MSPKPFTDFELHPDLLEGLGKMGYTHATAVQDEAIPHVQSGKDLMVQARTGTGKTLGFGLPTLQRIDPTNPDTQVLVICPTRELALQVSDELARVAEKMQIIVAAVFGGVKIETQIDKMQWAPVVVGTPGRLRDHIERGYLHLDTCKVVVLDEADEMLDMGFKDDLEYILDRVPAAHRQTLLFSATFPPEIVKIAHKYMRNPEKIEVSSGFTPAVGLTHKFARVPKDKKIQAMGTLLRNPDVASAIIFCETKVEAAWVHQRLKREGITIGILTGDIPQEKRLTTLQQFRDGELNVLVATDVAARGLDIPAVSHVFHFTVPRDTATYIHRSGRTARAGKSGIAFTLVTQEEERDFQNIMRDLKQTQGGGQAQAPRQPHAAAPAPAGPRQPAAPAAQAGQPNGRPGQPSGQAPGRFDGRGARLTPEQAGVASQIFQAISSEAANTEPYRGLVDALMSRGDSRRILAALLSQTPQAEAWLDVAPQAPDQPQAEDRGEGQDQGRREGRRRRRGGRGRGGRQGGQGEMNGAGFPAAAEPAAAPAPVAAPARPAPVEAGEAAPKPVRQRSVRKASAEPEAAPVVMAVPTEAVEAPKKRRTTKRTEAAEAPAAEVTEAPKKTRTTRAKAVAEPVVEEKAPVKRATRAKKTTEAATV
ncbi:MAG: DEAD/DEAH box helicase [Candidatus Sericytochromatia bacterium]|nr:DEAD/DEAH box helicase [Candidatus Sericytochromatia bacterium]